MCVYLLDSYQTLYIKYKITISQLTKNVLVSSSHFIINFYRVLLFQDNQLF